MSLLAACSTPNVECSGTSLCDGGRVCVNGACVVGDGGQADGTQSDIASDRAIDVVLDTAPACTPGTTCAGGVCVAGTCCAADHVCGDACCGSAEICFANTCVTPGNTCHTNTECPTGSYCEPALGTGGTSDAGVDASASDVAPTDGAIDGSPVDGGARDAGPTDAGADGGPVCTVPAPIPGRCLALPARCPTGADGGVADAGSTCIQACEYRPPVGLLDATLAWNWGPTAMQFPGYTDVWSTPAVGRVYDANCDGRVDAQDPPDIIFVAGRAIDATTGLGTCCQCNGTVPTSCHTGVLRVLDGRNGHELMSLRRAAAGSSGFSGVSVAIADLDRTAGMEIAAVTGEGYVVIIDRSGTVLRTSNMPIPGSGDGGFGWGGGLSIADMDGDGSPEIAFGPTVFTTAGGTLTRRFSGAAGGGGGGVTQYLSTMADLDGAANNHLELLAGRTAYRDDGTMLWNRTDLPDGFPAVADLNGDHLPEAVLVANGQLWVLNAATGVTVLGPLNLPGTGAGGAPTIANFDGLPGPEIGVAQANFYSVLVPDFTAHTIRVLWQMANHDLSSSVTGSTVFDFEGDGTAEVLYADECFVWVYDGPTGHVRWTGLTTSFTGTEASIVADVDGDGHAEIVSISNGADPTTWRCNQAPWTSPDPVTGRPAWVPPRGGVAYRGVRVYRDAASSWVGTRSIWNQHAYHVTNICMPGDDACEPGSYEGQVPLFERANWSLPWLNNFRQNVQQSGLFSAPDATVTLTVSCAEPPELIATVRNLGEAILPAGVTVGFFQRMTGGGEMQLGTGTTSGPLFSGAAQTIHLATPVGTPVGADFIARIIVDPAHPTFHECRTGNNESAPAHAPCPG